MIPQSIRDRTEEVRQLQESCAICERDLIKPDVGPAIFWEGNGVVTRYAHVACVDWTQRESPTRDLLRRIRSTRRKAAQLDRTLAIAERIAMQMDQDWAAHAGDCERLKRLALKYFKLLDRTRAVIVEALGGW